MAGPLSEQWLANIQWPDYLSSDVKDIAIARDGSIFVAGNSTNLSLKDSDKKKVGGGYVAKYGPTGNMLWLKKIPGFQPQIKSIEIGPTGSLYLGGSTDGELNGLAPGNPPDGFVIKFDENGLFSWMRLVDSGSYDTAVDMTIGTDDSILIAGNTRGVQDEEVIAVEGKKNRIGDNAFIAKLDKDGRQSWIIGVSGLSRLGSYYGSPTNEVTSSIEALPSGQSYIVGDTDAYQFGKDINAVSGRRIGFIAKIDVDGKVLWKRLLDTGSADPRQPFIPSASAIGRDGSLYVAGGADPFFISKYNSEGKLIWSSFLKDDGKIGDMYESPDGSLYVALGSAIDSETGERGSTSVDLSIVKLNQSGVKEWDYRVRKHGGQYGIAIKPGIDSSWLVATREDTPTGAFLINLLDPTLSRVKSTFDDSKSPSSISTMLGMMSASDWEMYVDRYPLTLGVIYNNLIKPSGQSKAAFGESHFINYGQYEGRVLNVITGKEDLNDYGAYVENYGTTLLDVYRTGVGPTDRGDRKLSMFEWGKWHFETYGKAEGRDVSGGVDWGAIVLKDSRLRDEYTTAKRLEPSITAFRWGFLNQSMLRSVYGPFFAVGTEGRDLLKGMRVFGNGGDDVIIGTAMAESDILHGGFGNDIIIGIDQYRQVKDVPSILPTSSTSYEPINPTKDYVYGGPGEDQFVLSKGSWLHIQDFKKGVDLIRLGNYSKEQVYVEDELTLAVPATNFFDASTNQRLATIYGQQAGSFTYFTASRGLANVFV